MKKKLMLTTSFHENRPVSLAGIGLWSKRTNALEEAELQELQLEAIAPKGTEVIDHEVQIVQMLLHRRVRKEEDRELITEDWVRQHVGKENAERMIAYFRTGDLRHLEARAAEGGVGQSVLDLPDFEELELDGRTFRMNAMPYSEMLHVMGNMDLKEMTDLMDGALAIARDVPENESSEQMLERIKAQGLEVTRRTAQGIRKNAERVAYVLNRRIADGGPQIDANWLLERLDAQQLNDIMNFLRNGTEPQAAADEGEAASKNAVLGPAGS